MPYKAFRTDYKGSNRLLFYTPSDINLLQNKEYFSKNTEAIKVIRGYEVEKIEGSRIGNDELLMIIVQYSIGEYFGDYSGRHIKERAYVLIDGVLYKESGEVMENIPSELKGVLGEISNK